MVKVVVPASELRKLDDQALEAKLVEFRKELNELRIGQSTGAAASRIAKIRPTRRNIARCLTLLTQRQKEAAKKKWEGKKRLPYDMRPKMPRSVRQRLTPEQLTKKLPKVKARHTTFAKRKFTIRMED